MKTWISAVAGVLLSVTAASADEKRFGYSREAKVMPKGQFEFEQWATYRFGKDIGNFRTWDFREELEYGVTDRLTTAFYLNYTHERFSGETEFEFEGFSSEWKYKFSDPSADPIGFLIYGELSAGPDESELEIKAVFSKHVDAWTFAANLVIEFEREEEEEPNGDIEIEKESALALTFGVSRDLGHGFAAGLEILHRLGFEGTFKETEANGQFIGPVVSYAGGTWYALLTVLRQIDIKENSGRDLDHFEEGEVRLVFGILF